MRRPIAQIAADALGLPLERFRFRQGDTDDLDCGGGHGGARSMHQGGTALLMAAEGLIENARQLAARLLQTGVDAVRYEAGMLRVAATGQEISLDGGGARLLPDARRRRRAGSGAQGERICATNTPFRMAATSPKWRSIPRPAR